VRRRDFITLLGGVALAWPLAARAQQAAIPVIGYLSQGSPEADAFRLTGFRRGLKEGGYVEGQNLTIEYRWASNQFDRLPALAADLVHHGVTVIVAPGARSTFAAKTATPTIPIVFGSGADPVQLGLVASLNRPGGNLTGVHVFGGEIASKGLELLHELLPAAASIGFLEDPTNPIAELRTRDILAAARAIGVELKRVHAGTESEIDAAFASLAQAHAGALLVPADLFFNNRLEQLVALAARYAIPTICGIREFPVAGGLMSYGIQISEIYRLTGIYAARILKGEKPADIPVIQLTKIELVVNLKTAKTLGLTILPSLLARADEVIE
jgi:putative tryptophan/tyrosine transport system substrate-binding protein